MRNRKTNVNRTNRKNRSKSMKSSGKVILIEDGSLVGWQKPLEPAMLTPNGVTYPTSIPGVSIRLGKAYAIGKVMRDLGLTDPSELAGLAA